jgi:membrane protein DedA with SNARE-associated domain
MPSLTHLSPDSIVSYFVALLVPLLDAIIPAFPSETAVIALGVASGSGLGLGVVTLVALAALGAFAGDNLSYWLGRRFGPRVERRLLRGEKGRRSREWAERTLKSRGAMLIIVCRFIPGGRTAVTLTAGLVGYPRRSFVGATAAAASSGPTTRSGSAASAVRPSRATRGRRWRSASGSPARSPSWSSSCAAACTAPRRPPERAAGSLSRVATAHDIPGAPESGLAPTVAERLPADAPPAPWDAALDAVIWMHRATPAAAEQLPTGVRGRRAVPWTLGAAIRYAETPVGAYDEVLASPLVLVEWPLPAAVVSFIAVTRSRPSPAGGATGRCRRRSAASRGPVGPRCTPKATGTTRRGRSTSRCAPGRELWRSACRRAPARRFRTARPGPCPS